MNRAMVCEEFNEWARRTGLKVVAEKVSEYEAERGSGRSVTYQSVQDWLKKGVPPVRVLCVETLSGIPRSQLRPDIYPAEKIGASA